MSPTAVAAAVPVRPLLYVLAPLCLVVLYLITWWVYSYTHLERRYVQLEAGAGYDFEGTTVRVLGVVSAERLADAEGGATPALSGATWVVAELEAEQVEGAKEFFCNFELVGPDGRTWKSEFPAKERALPYCSGENIRPGPPHRFELVFQVPLADADQLFGITQDDPASPTRTPVLSPPR